MQKVCPESFIRSHTWAWVGYLWVDLYHHLTIRCIYNFDTLVGHFLDDTAWSSRENCIGFYDLHFLLFSWHLHAVQYCLYIGLNVTSGQPDFVICQSIRAKVAKSPVPIRNTTDEFGDSAEITILQFLR